MSGPIRRIVTGVCLFAAICLIAVCGYLTAGWSLMDSIYMVVITIFGVGYGEVKPIESAPLRVLTISVIVAGYGAVIYTVGGFVQMVIDGELNRALGARRMSNEIERLKGHVIICGVGRMGTILAGELAGAKTPFVVIDNDEERLQMAQDHGWLIVHGDATEDEVLERAGIHRAAIIATVLSEDTDNVFITLTARELNAELQIIARAEHPGTEKKLRRCGADHIVLPTAIGANRVAQLITRPSAESLLEQADAQASLRNELEMFGLRIDQLAVGADSMLHGRSIADIAVRGNFGFLIVGIRRAGGTIELSPSTETILHTGDDVIVLGHNDDIPQLADRYALTQQITYRGATSRL